MENDGADSSKSPNSNEYDDKANSPKDETEIINIESSEDEYVILEHHRCSPKTSPCKVCSKTSTSGEALLGGRASSSHVQASNEEQTPVKKSPNPKRSLETADLSLSRLLIACDICGKKVGSNKSLFNHMRSHPKRGYRGMEPPLLKLDSSTYQTIDAERDRMENDRPGGPLLALHCDRAKSGSDKLILNKGLSVRGKRGREPVIVNDDPLRVSDSNSKYMFEMWMKLLKLVGGDRLDKKAKVCDRSDDVRTKDCNDGNSSNALTNPKVDTTTGKGKDNKMAYYNDIVDEDHDDEYCEILILEQGCKSGEEGTLRNFLNSDKAVENLQNDLETQEKMEDEEEEGEETRVVDDSTIREQTNGAVLSSEDRKDGNDGDDESYVCDYCKEVFASGEAHKCSFGAKLLGFDLNEPYVPQDIYE